jgi:hypothetical protein
VAESRWSLDTAIARQLMPRSSYPSLLNGCYSVMSKQSTMFLRKTTPRLAGSFGGEAVTDTLAAVIRAEPDWTLLPKDTPTHVRVLLQRCMKEDAKQRLRDIGDARIALEEVLSGVAKEQMAAAGASRPVWRRALPWAVAALCALVAAGLAAYLYLARQRAAMAAT